MSHIGIIDLIGHVDNLEEALNFITKIPIKLKLGLWMYHINAHRSHKDVGSYILQAQKSLNTHSNLSSPLAPCLYRLENIEFTINMYIKW